jgi:hypothetical protein
MRKELYVVCFESMNYCGAGETCLAWGVDEEDAKEAAAEHAEDFYREQDEEQYIEENGEDGGVMWATVTSAVLLKGSEYEQWAFDPSQASFYQLVN